MQLLSEGIGAFVVGRYAHRSAKKYVTAMKDLDLERNIAIEEAATFSDRDRHDDDGVTSEDDYYDRLYEEVKERNDYWSFASGQYDLAF